MKSDCGANSQKQQGGEYVEFKPISQGLNCEHQSDDQQKWACQCDQLWCRRVEHTNEQLGTQQPDLKRVKKPTLPEFEPLRV